MIIRPLFSTTAPQRRVAFPARAACLVSLAALAFGTGCSRRAAVNARELETGNQIHEGKLLLTGSSTMAPLMEEIARLFLQLHPGVEITVKTGGSGVGIQDARQGRADIGMASRALTEAEGDLSGLPIARDGICLVVHQDNPVRSLTDAQIAAIYTGSTANWKEVGGLDAPILVLTRTEGRSEVELFLHYFKIDKAAVKAESSIGDNLAGIQEVSTNRDAVVYMSVGAAERSVKSGVPIRLLPIAGVTASSQSIRSGNYPLSRPLTLVTKGSPKGLVEEFLNFCLSAHVTDLIRRQDFVPFLD